MKIDKKILSARMNFTHFVPTHKNLTPKVLSDLFVDLLRRSAALQLCPNQPTYDILIPVYFGKESQPLKPSECGGIVVAVKNKDASTTPVAIFQETFKKLDGSRITSSNTPIRGQDNNFLFNGMKMPILFLLFDLGFVRTDSFKALAVEVSYTSKKRKYSSGMGYPFERARSRCFCLLR
jgi:hypothetical protein